MKLQMIRIPEDILDRFPLYPQHNPRTLLQSRPQAPDDPDKPEPPPASRSHTALPSHSTPTHESAETQTTSSGSVSVPPAAPSTPVQSPQSAPQQTDPDRTDPPSPLQRTVEQLLRHHCRSHPRQIRCPILRIRPLHARNLLQRRPFKPLILHNPRPRHRNKLH